MKVYWESGGIAPHILDLDTRWGWVVGFMLQLLYHQGKSPQYTFDRRLWRPQSQPQHDGEEKNSQPLPGPEPLIIQPIAQCYTPELSQLLIILRNSMILWILMSLTKNEGPPLDPIVSYLNPVQTDTAQFQLNPSSVS
jgi:hypothetical protein